MSDGKKSGWHSGAFRQQIEASIRLHKARVEARKRGDAPLSEAEIKEAFSSYTETFSPEYPEPPVALDRR